ncbi:MAG: VIT1/CCC1 transporter family protein [Alicyclobacillus sp.]|nr:VIT1/CCC1 transporter family protein [Alicyclobacillus sp.]
MSTQSPSLERVAQNLQSIWGRERWHKTHTTGWIGDAIYGVNDGLGAIFGIIAGVAGYTANTHTVLISGLFGALASTLSMGAGAWLATKSENELRARELAVERQEILEDPEHEMEELALLYQLKGFDEEASRAMAEQIAKDTNLFVRTMAQEELGFPDEANANPWKSAGIGSLSTLVGGVVPLLPFFFLHGIVAMVAAAVVSIAAHFAVGAAKSAVTARSWWASGIEMTLAGIVVGVVAYGLGWIGTLLIHP